MLENNVLLSICSFVTVLLYSLVDQIPDIYVFFFRLIMTTFGML